MGIPRHGLLLAVAASLAPVPDETISARIVPAAPVRVTVTVAGAVTMMYSLTTGQAIERVKAHWQLGGL